jgi:NADPH:quinone reductase-like Zn-dependent oxidoreductase
MRSVPLLTALLVLAASSARAQTCPELPATMKAVQQVAYGGPEGVALREVAVERPAAGEVLVAVHASSVNPIDWMLLDGPGRPPTLPAKLGLDVAGVVAALGEGVTGWVCGDAVVAYLGQKARGAFAEYVRVPAAQLARKPASLSFVEAGTYPLVALTAWQSLVDLGRIARGERVLVHGGAGGVGSAAVQIAKARGAHVTATASARNHAYLRSLGADAVIDYRTRKFEDEVSDLDLVFDTVGGDTTQRSAKVLREGGRLLSIRGSLPVADCEARRLDCRFHRVRPDANGLAEIGRLVDSGRFRVHVDARYPLAEVGAAMEKNREGHTRGKIAVVVRAEPGGATSDATR